MVLVYGKYQGKEHVIAVCDDHYQAASILEVVDYLFEKTLKIEVPINTFIPPDKG